MPPDKKVCNFHCGCSNQDADVENPSVFMRWAYKDGSGFACWYCERVWQVKEAHKWDSRQEFQAELATDKNTKDMHDRNRAEFISDRKSGKRNMKQKREGGP